MNEPKYRAVWPLGKSASEAVSMKPRIDDLRGKTIANLSHGGFRDPEVRPIVEEVLAREFPGIKFIDHTVFGYIHGRDPAAVLAALPDNLRKHKVDAVITGIGA